MAATNADRIRPQCDESSIRQEARRKAAVVDEPMKRSRKKLLLGFRRRMEDEILGDRLLEKSSSINRRPLHRLFPARDEVAKVSDAAALREVSLWGVPLLPSRGHHGTDVVLMKFLRANDFKVADAFEMLRKTLIWRRDFFGGSGCSSCGGSDGERDLCGQDPGGCEDAAVFSEGGRDRLGHPLCFYVVGGPKDLSENALGLVKRRERFVRLRVQYMERSIQRLNFKTGEVGSVVQITDLKNSSTSGAAGTHELRAVTIQALLLIQENYPELVHRNIIINVPFWYCTFRAVLAHFISERSRSKFVLARPKRVTQTLLKFIAPENIPIQYGGLWRENDDEFSTTDKVFEQSVVGGVTKTIQIPISEVGVTAVWDVMVVGWEVSYKEEFTPDDECSYTILLKKEKKLKNGVRNSFYIGEPGKIVITINNGTFKNKRVFYRYRTRLTVPMYLL